MPATPKYKVISPDGDYVAACRYAEDAANLVGIYGPGAKIKLDGRIIWREGSEEISAGDSFDRAREIIHGREEYRRAEAHLRLANAIPAARIPDDPFDDLPGSGVLG